MKKIILAVSCWLLFQQCCIAQGFSKAEYFFDTDPGAGNGTAISLTGTSDTINFSAAIPTTSLSQGFHLLALRMQHNDGKWGLFEKRGFYIYAAATGAAYITAAEYFFDADPGVGNGTAASVGASGAIVNFTANIPTSLPVGFHILAIRTKDADGKLGLFEKRSFYVLPPASGMGFVVSGEYFFDTDPGVGNGLPFNFATPGNIVNQTLGLVVPVPTGQGNHLMVLRVRDANGYWSLFDTARTITVFGVLPLHLLNFTGKKINNNTLLEWKTENEVNVNRFEIQRSDDGQSFVTVGTVLPGSASYSFTDAGVFNSKSIVFYRLKSIDDDGKFTYSNIIRLSSQLTTQLSVFPNPVKDVVAVSGLKQNGHLLLFSAEGKLLQQQKVAVQSTTINMSSYKAGVYMLQYQINGEIFNQKIIKQ
ncbi:MAG: T9SS type A sorting domain-containing protein [Bacteroidota bacterium]|nr:T9SS type A sorting domain-containing protein [Bacteroidota bacterium]